MDLTEADLGDGLKALQLVPQDIEDEDFTYYDEDVQERLYQMVQELKKQLRPGMDRLHASGHPEPLRHRKQRPVPLF